MAHMACHRFANIAPTKVRRIAEMIRGMPADEALETLKFVPNRGARLLEKVLQSALANAEEKGERNVESMVVVESKVDEGPRMKRIRPRARGMAFGILKRMSHLTIAVDVT